MILSKLPSEIIHLICHFLESRDLCALRLSGRVLAEKTLFFFENNFFSRLELLVTEDNLALLRDIAKNERLRNRVREVWVRPALFEGAYNLNYELSYHLQIAVDGAAARKQDNTEARFQNYRQAVQTFRETIQSQEFQDVFCSTFACFPNLKTVGLFHDLCSMRASEELSFRVRCRGWKQLVDDVGFNPAVPRFESAHEYPEASKNRELAFRAVLSAIAANLSTNTVERLDTCGELCTGILPRGTTLKLSEPEHVKEAVRRLKHLHLCLRTYSKSYNIQAYQSILDIVQLAAPGLESLKYSQDHTLQQSRFENLTKLVQFPRLVKLELMHINTTAQGLSSFLRTAGPTLRYLYLGDISLQSGKVPTSDRIVTEHGDFIEDTKNEWRLLWRSLRDKMEALEHIEFNRINRGRLRIIDPLRPRSGGYQPSTPALFATYDVKKSKVRSAEWLEKLKIP